MSTKLRTVRSLKGKEIKLQLRVPVQMEMSAEGGDETPTFTALAYSGGLVPGYTAGLNHDYVVDLNGMEPARNIVANLDHKSDKRVGHVTEMVNDGNELHLAGKLSAATEYQREVAESAKNGFAWECSIEGACSGAKKIPAKKTIEVNGREVTGPAYVVRKAKLTGVAFVSHGADEGNAVQIAASAASETPMSDFEKFALSLGVDLEDATDEQKTNLQKQFELTQQPPPEETPNPEPASTLQLGGVGGADSFRKMAEKRHEEHERQEAIRKLGLAAMDASPLMHTEIRDVTEQAIESKMSVDHFELMLRRTLPEALNGSMSINRGGNQRRNPKVMAAALMMTAGLDAEQAYGADICQAVEDNGMRGFGLQQAILEAAAAKGAGIRPGQRITQGNFEQIFHAAFSPGATGRTFEMANYSSTELPGILGAVANKSLLQGYMESDSTWRAISEIKSVSNFHIQNHYRMLDNLEYELVGPGGNIPHGEVSEETYTSQTRTYGRMLGLTRQDIINDDLGAFDTIRARLGLGAAMKFNDVVWSVFMDNAAHFTAGRGNYIEGATTALTLDGQGLEQGVTAYYLQQSPAADGEKYVNANISEPTMLIVPPALKFIADRLYQSTNIVSGTTNDPGNPDANIHAGNYTPIVQARLQNANFTGNSAAAWYLLGANLKPVVVTFLNGQQTPVIESAQADFSTLGVNFRGYFDFGADLGEYLGIVKSKGEA